MSFTTADRAAANAPLCSLFTLLSSLFAQSIALSTAMPRLRDPISKTRIDRALPMLKAATHA